MELVLSYFGISENGLNIYENILVTVKIEIPLRSTSLR